MNINTKHIINMQNIAKEMKNVTENLKIAKKSWRAFAVEVEDDTVVGINDPDFNQWVVIDQDDLGLFLNERTEQIVTAVARDAYFAEPGSVYFCKHLALALADMETIYKSYGDEDIIFILLSEDMEQMFIFKNGDVAVFALPEQ